MLGTLDFTQFRAEDGSNTKRRVQGVYSPPTTAAGGYVTGGDTVLPADMKLGQLDYLDPGNGLTATNVLYEPAYDYVNQKLLLFVGSTGLEVASTTDLSAVKFRFEAIGR
jgi:hypothetical protein